MISFSPERRQCLDTAWLNSGSCFFSKIRHQTCGDVDFVISHEEDEVRLAIFDRLLARLREINFLKEDLSVGDDTESTQQ